MTVNGTGPATSWMAEKTLVADLDESVVPEPPSSLKAMSSDTEISIAWLPPRHNRIMVRGTVECSCVNIVAFCSCFSSSVTVFHRNRQLEISKYARTYLQLPLGQWGAGNVYLLVLSS